MPTIPSPYVDNPSADNWAYSDAELGLLSRFKENDLLLKLVRKVFWQEELSDKQVKEIQNQISTDVYAVLLKLFHPRMSSDDGIMDVASRWLTPSFANNLTRETKSHVLGRQDAVRFVDKGLDRLLDIVENGDSKQWELVIDIQMRGDYEQKSEDEVRRAVIAHQEALTFLESRLVQIRMLAGRKTETLADRTTRLKKDSTK
jgi:predicted negative regulator of RcsB-dependent stress response